MYIILTTAATDANSHVLKSEVSVTLSLCFKFDRFYIYYLLRQSPTLIIYFRYYVIIVFYAKYTGYNSYH